MVVSAVILYVCSSSSTGSEARLPVSPAPPRSLQPWLAWDHERATRENLMAHGPGTPDTLLPPDPAGEALAGDPTPERLVTAVRAHPESSLAWALLAERPSRPAATAPTWRRTRTPAPATTAGSTPCGARAGGAGPIPWEHEPNRGFLRALGRSPSRPDGSARRSRTSAAPSSCATPRRPRTRPGLIARPRAPDRPSRRPRAGDPASRERRACPRGSARGPVESGARVLEAIARGFTLRRRSVRSERAAITCRALWWWEPSGATRARARRPTSSVTGSTTASATRAATTRATRRGRRRALRAAPAAVGDPQPGLRPGDRQRGGGRPRRAVQRDRRPGGPRRGRLARC